MACTVITHSTNSLSSFVVNTGEGPGHTGEGHAGLDIQVRGLDWFPSNVVICEHLIVLFGTWYVYRAVILIIASKFGQSIKALACQSSNRVVIPSNLSTSVS